MIDYHLRPLEWFDDAYLQLVIHPTCFLVFGTHDQCPVEGSVWPSHHNLLESVSSSRYLLLVELFHYHDDLERIDDRAPIHRSGKLRYYAVTDKAAQVKADHSNVHIRRIAYTLVELDGIHRDWAIEMDAGEANVAIPVAGNQ